MTGRNRKHGIIDSLPADLKAAVEQMMQNDFTYQEIAEYIKENGFDISVTSVWRHAKNLNATLQTLKMAQENFRTIMEEIGKYPQMDTSEGIIRLLSHHILERIQGMNENEMKAVDPVDLMRQTTALVRAATYKSHVDLKNKEILDSGYEAIKKMVFESMAKERPDLYEEVRLFLDSKKEE